MKKLNSILLIDDNPADNYYHKSLLEEMNVTESVQIAENGEEALKFLQKENQVIPELIFLDINMPKMDGWEFLDEFRNLPSKIKKNTVIVLLSTSTNPKDINRSQEIAEVSNFETKPLNEDAIENILERYF